MTVQEVFLDELVERLLPPPGPRSLPWPGDGQPRGFRTFASFDDWKAYVHALELVSVVPLTVLEKYRRAQKLYLLGWLDTDFIKAGELVALTALELAVADRYWHKVLASRKPGKPSKGDGLPKSPHITFAQLLDYMVTGDQLTDHQLSVVCEHGGRVTDRLRLKDPRRPTLVDLRNDAAHGYPFDGLPHCGLIEVVRDLIGYAYRDNS